VLQKAGISKDDVDFFEINEASAFPNLILILPTFFIRIDPD
jgi:acetyl-CoA acetyltransferase